MKRGYFDTWLTLPNDDEVTVRVQWEGSYLPARISGPIENCHPEESEMEIVDVEFVGDWPEGLSADEASDLAESSMDRFLDLAWENYHAN